MKLFKRNCSSTSCAEKSEKTEEIDDFKASSQTCSKIGQQDKAQENPESDEKIKYT